MAKLKPVSWLELLKHLKRFGFQGPYQSGKHPYMLKGDLTLTIPNPHPYVILVLDLVVLSRGRVDIWS